MRRPDSPDEGRIERQGTPLEDYSLLLNRASDTDPPSCMYGLIDGWINSTYLGVAEILINMFFLGDV